jgi:nicotinamide-nucleotide amidase
MSILNDMDKIINECATLLIDGDLTLAFAESATAGRAAAEFSLAESAGKFLKGGLVCYDAGIKEELLGVSPELVEKYTPESAEVTVAITKGISKLIPSDISIGITGLTCPGGSETAEKPVGTMFIYGVHNGREIIDERVVFEGNPEQIVIKTVAHIAALLRLYLLTLKP